MFCGSIAASFGGFANGLNGALRALRAEVADLEGRPEVRVCRLERVVGLVSG